MSVLSVGGVVSSGSGASDGEFLLQIIHIRSPPIKNLIRVLSFHVFFRECNL
jgi:hypothetical protein